MFFITKNLNWEILTKNLVTFKRWGIGFIYERGTAWKGGLEEFANLRGVGKKEGVVVFLRGVDTPMHTIAFPGRVSHRCWEHGRVFKIWWGGA